MRHYNLPGFIVMIVFEVAVATIQLRKVSKLMRASTIKSTTGKKKIHPLIYIKFSVH